MTLLQRNVAGDCRKKQQHISA